MGKFFGIEIKKTPVKLTNTVVQLPSGSFLKLGGQGYTLLTNLQADLTVSGLGGLEAGSVIPANGVMFLFVVRDGNTNYLTISSSNTSSYVVSSFVGFIQINNSTIFDVYRFDTQEPTSENISYSPSISGGLNISTTYYSYYRREGLKVVIKVSARCGTIDGNTATYSMPDNLLCSSTLTPDVGVNAIVGSFQRKVNSLDENSVIIPPLNNIMRFGLRNSTANNIDNALAATNLILSNELFYFDAVIPIEGWTDNLQKLLG